MKKVKDVFFLWDNTEIGWGDVNSGTAYASLTFFIQGFTESFDITMADKDVKTFFVITNYEREYFVFHPQTFYNPE